MKVLLLSLYDLGRQPFGLSSLAAWLRKRSAEVSMIDLAVEDFDVSQATEVGLVGIHLPMHTATKLALEVIGRLKSAGIGAPICCFGLYTPMNEAFLREKGVSYTFGGEFESEISDLYDHLSQKTGVADRHRTKSIPELQVPKLIFIVPDRRGLPPLDKYSKLITAEGLQVLSGHTEASRGCKHLCRHCPIVPVYEGAFRIIDREVVLADIAQQVEAGAKHISFGDPDFFNGITHSLKIIERFHDLYPRLTYDVTIKVEHLLKHKSKIEVLKDSGCLFITTAAESLDDEVLRILDKGHTRQDFLEIVQICRDVGIHLSPTFVPFTPWTTRSAYLDLLKTLEDVDLVESVSPIQFAIRLLLPAGSRLMELDETKEFVTGFNSEGLAFAWNHPDSAMDELHQAIQAIVQTGEAQNKARRAIFEEIWDLTSAGSPALWNRRPDTGVHAAQVPRMTEQWYCCAEPADRHFIRM